MALAILEAHSMEKRVSKIIGASDLTIETGKLAKLADGSVTVRSGETIILVAAVSATSVKEGQDFFPLTVDYREKAAAAGKFPGGYFKREGRPSEKETLTSRMTDRPLRPLFPKGYFYDTQVISVLLSADGENDPATARCWITWITAMSRAWKCARRMWLSILFASKAMC